MALGGDDKINITTSMAMQAQHKRDLKLEKERTKLLSSVYIIHNSSIRPFLCCTRQISINSITETQDEPVQSKRVSYANYEGCMTSSDSPLENMETNGFHPAEKKQHRIEHLSTHLVNIKRKKNLSELDTLATRKKFWSPKLRLKHKAANNNKSQHVSKCELDSQTHDNNSMCVHTAYKSSTLASFESVHITGKQAASLTGVQVATLLHNQPAISCDQFSEENHDGKGQRHSRTKIMSGLNMPVPFINNLNQFHPIIDTDKQLLAQRRFEIEHGIEVVKMDNGDNVWLHQPELNNTQGRGISLGPSGQYASYGATGLCLTESLSNGFGTSVNMQELSDSHMHLSMNPGSGNLQRPLLGIHTQVDYKHYLVPELNKIINSSFYWGVMDRYQAESLIENKADGTFLLRDSAQDDYLFSVSFRRHGRSLHARIEQWNHRFSFDSRDPSIFSADTVCGLIEHFKNPSSCMYFEPLLTIPMLRKNPLTLKQLTRAAICSNITYDGISKLGLPASLKEYLRPYHYKQKVRVRRFDNVQ